MCVCNIKEIRRWVSEIGPGNETQTDGRRTERQGIQGDAITPAPTGDKNIGLHLATDACTVSPRVKIDCFRHVAKNIHTITIFEGFLDISEKMAINIINAH